MKRALVSLPDQLFRTMNTKLKGKFGQNDSEIIRSIVIVYLSQQGYLRNDEFLGTGIQEDTNGATVDTLEEKGIVTGKDIDKRIRRRIKSKRQLTNFGVEMT